MIWQFQPINKTIGINKLGTLLSSQTTDTPGTTTTQIKGRDSLRSNFSNLPDHQPQCKPAYSPNPTQWKGPHPKNRRAIPHHFPGCSSGGRSLSFRFSGGDSNNFTHEHRTTQIRPAGWPRPKNPGNPGLSAPPRPKEPASGPKPVHVRSVTTRRERCRKRPPHGSRHRRLNAQGAGNHDGCRPLLSHWLQEC